MPTQELTEAERIERRRRIEQSFRDLEANADAIDDVLALVDSELDAWREELDKLHDEVLDAVD